jgi:hypothetical protein
MTSANQMERQRHHQKRRLKEKYQGEKKCPDKQQPTGRSVKIQKCQEQAGTRDSGSIRQRCREQDKDKHFPGLYL